MQRRTLTESYQWLLDHTRLKVVEDYLLFVYNLLTWDRHWDEPFDEELFWVVRIILIEGKVRSRVEKGIKEGRDPGLLALECAIYYAEKDTEFNNKILNLKELYDRITANGTSGADH